MLAKYACFLGFLFLTDVWAMGQCPFNHSLWGRVEWNHSQQLEEASSFYPGEYVEILLQANQCYNLVLIDTFSRALQLMLTDSSANSLKVVKGRPGEALQMSWQATETAKVFVALSAKGCNREWMPSLLLIEWKKEDYTCDE